MEFLDWGLIEYSEALSQQLALVDKVIQNPNLGYLIFCSHPPVVTLGRKTQEGDVTTWSGPVLEISRGGRATYHGPSQLVVYPIISIAEGRHGRAPQEIGGFLRVLEQGIIEVLKSYGIESQGRTNEETGVWVGNQKIASLGIAVKNWVTYHGAAINLEHDQSAFQGMKPCGFNPEVMTDLESLLVGSSPNRKDFSEKLKNILLKTL
jgi:lipoyl(octanoyl) transferase